MLLGWSRRSSKQKPGCLSWAFPGKLSKVSKKDISSSIGGTVSFRFTARCWCKMFQFTVGFRFLTTSLGLVGLVESFSVLELSAISYQSIISWVEGSAKDRQKINLRGRWNRPTRLLVANQIQSITTHWCTNSSHPGYVGSIGWLLGKD